MKYLKLFTIVLLFSSQAFAQPQYKYPQPWKLPGASTDSWIFMNNKTQYIYTASELGLPQCVISEVWVYAPTIPGGSGFVTANNVVIKLGTTSSDSFAIAAGTDSAYFETGLTTVYSGPVSYYSRYSFDSLWAKIPLQTPFYYDGSSNLVYEFTENGIANPTKYRMYRNGQTATTYPKRQGCAAPWSSTNAMGVIKKCQGFVGFNMLPVITPVPRVSSQSEIFDLYGRRYSDLLSVPSGIYLIRKGNLVTKFFKN